MSADCVVPDCPHCGGELVHANPALAAESVVLSEQEKSRLLKGLGWAISEGALESGVVVDLAVKLGADRAEWMGTYGPYVDPFDEDRPEHNDGTES